MTNFEHTPLYILENMLEYSKGQLKEHKRFLKLAEEQVARCQSLIDYEENNIKEYNKEFRRRNNKEWGLK